MGDKIGINSVRLSSDAPETHYDGSMGASMAQGGMDVDGLIFVYVGDVCVADFQVEKTPSAWHMHTSVAKEWRRKGIASLLYDLVDEQALASGAKLAPSPTQTEMAILFWADRVKSNAFKPLAENCMASQRLKERRDESKANGLVSPRPIPTASVKK